MERCIQLKPRTGNTQKGVWFVAIGASFWGIAPPLRALILKSMTTIQFMWLEHLLIALYVIPVLWMHRQELCRCTWKHLLAVLSISWGCSVTAGFLFNKAFVYGDPNGVLLLQKIQPLFALLLARIMLKEKLPKRFSLWLFMALVGGYLLTFGWAFPFRHSHEVIGVSALFSLGAAFLWGCQTVVGRFLVRRMAYEVVASLRFLLALPLLTVLFMMETSSWNNSEAGWGTLIFLIFLQALFAIASLLLYYRGLASTKASYATLAELACPMAGLLMNGIVLHKVVTGVQITGFVFIWVSLYFISKKDEYNRT